MSSLSLPARIAQGSTLFLCRLLNSLWKAHKARAAYQRSLTALYELDDSRLRDIGLTRADQKRGYPEY
ncbi:DUF1127 domain-containing protein [Ferrovibrio terrae]|uniref:DUF1127 domain-containing protein n=1 Tax=Ferrovibrio terrae TaxID=2594003 RepID=UPI0031380E97